MILTEYLGGVTEIAITGDIVVHPWRFRAWRIVPDTDNHRAKLPLRTSPAWKTGSSRLVIWNDSAFTLLFTENDNTLIRSLSAGEVYEFNAYL